MSYTITHYNGSAFSPALTVNDGTIDTTLDLKIIGKSYAGYGLAQNENFVYLLENFRSSTPPGKAIPGQIWYDSLTNKLKFYDVNSTWRTIGGSTATASANKPTNLTIGEFWYDSDHSLVYVFNGVDFTLVGGSLAAGTTTQMVSKLVKDTASPVPGTHAIIQAIANGETVFVVSAEASAFTLDHTQNDIAGFNIIQPGITLRDTPGSTESTPGQTTTAARFWGTASNADRLGGLDYTNFIQAGNATFTQLVSFDDPGYTVGTTPKLKVYIDGTGTPVIQNIANNSSIKFETTNISGATLNPLTISGSDLLPGNASGGNLGSSLYTWNSVYANYLYSTAQQADSFLIHDTAGLYKYATVANNTSDYSIVARDASGNINVTVMNGTATQANTVQLSGTNTYLPATNTASASSIAARDNLGNLSAVSLSAQSVVKSGTSGTGDIGQANNLFGNIYASTFRGSLAGNVTGNVTGNLTGSVLASVPAGQVTQGSALIDTATNKMRAASIQVGNGTAASPSIAFISDSGQSSGFYWTTNGTINIANAGVASGSFTQGGNLLLNGNVTAILFQGTATSARYADLAEKYLPDQDYETGTVVSVGGEKEITASSWGERPIGVISANPAYMMNSELEGGVYVALKGRVPVKVIGVVKKGQRLIASNGGLASAAVPHSNDVFAVALENNEDPGIKIVECVIL